MKTIAFALSEFPVLSETFVGNEIRALNQQGYKVKPFAFKVNRDDGQPIDSDLLQQAAQINQPTRLQALKAWVRNPFRSVRALSFILQQQTLPRKSLLLSAGKLAYLCQLHHCHHIHAHFALHTSATAIVAAKLLGVSVSFVGHGFDVYAVPADLPLKLKFANFSVAVCEDMKARFQAMAPNQKIHLIACGIDPLRYPFQPKRPTQNRLLFIGRLVEKKGLTDLLHALALIPDSHRPDLDIVGSGPLMAELKTLAALLQIQANISFLGSQTSDWIIEHASNYLALCAPFCEASNGDRDTGPLVVKEAMALGLPVICSSFMGCKEMLNHATGYLVPPNDPEALADAIQKVQTATDIERFALLKRARERVVRLFSSRTSGIKLAAAIEGARS